LADQHVFVICFSSLRFGRGSNNSLPQKCKSYETKETVSVLDRSFGSVGRTCIRSMWLRKETGGGHLWTR